MPRLTLIYPCLGREQGRRYVRSWQMEPLSMAALAALTPENWQTSFYDDRLEAIPFDAPCELVAISVETYTARRSYQIAAAFRKRGVKVVMGGYHATLCPEDAAEHADAVCIGEAEDVWPEMLRDAEKGALRKYYQSPAPHSLQKLRFDRSIFRGKNYLPLSLVEASRGCPKACSFCSVSAFHKANFRRRPAEEIAEEIRDAGAKKVFFVDDNFSADAEAAFSLCETLRPLGITWFTQVGIDALLNEKLLAAMASSGCLGVLCGFESLDPENLKKLRKQSNDTASYVQALRNLRKAGLLLYGTFMFGQPFDTPEKIRDAVRFAIRENFFIAAFNHTVPFPGTPLYEELRARDRMPVGKWWLDESFRFGEAPYVPEKMSSRELGEACNQARLAFYGIPSLLRRLASPQYLFRPSVACSFLGLNAMLRSEIRRKRGIPLGDADMEPPRCRES